MNNPMKKYAYREGVDITVAFATVLRPECGGHSDVGSSPTSKSVTAGSSDQAVVPGVSEVTSSGTSATQPRSHVRRLMKATLRAPVKILFRICKPLIRPLAFRLRAYLLDAIRAGVGDMREDIVLIRAEILELRQDVWHEVAELQQVAQVERLKFADSLTHQLRVTQNSLEQEMLARLLPPLGVLQKRVEQLTLGTEALARATAAPIQSPQLDRVEQLALEEAKARAETAPIQSRKLDRIEQLVLEEAKARTEAVPAQSQKFDRIEQLLLEETKARAETVLADLQKLDRIEQYALATARRFAVNCGGEQVLVRTEVGYLLCSGADQALLSILIEAGELEPGTRRVIQRILKPGDVFIDVGANVGLHTLAAAKAMEGRGKIIAFEPFAETARLLEASVWLNGFSSITEIHQAAVSTASGSQLLYLGATSGHHSLFPLYAETGEHSKSVQVPLVKIDDVIDEKQPVALIKIDVEGAELQVLETAGQTILRNPAIAIIAEFGRSHLQRTGHKSSEWIGAFTSLGLDYRAINEQTGSLEIWSIDQLEGVDSINVLFVRPGSPMLLA